MKTSTLISLVALTLAALACSLVTGNDDISGATVDEPLSADLQIAFDELPTGDAVRGEQIFVVDQPCHICHIDLSIGPPFPGEPPLAILAATRKPDYPAGVYLYESIVNPRAYVVQGFQADAMPENFGKTLTRQDLADLVAYLMTMQ